jgi:hypothetical protein
MKGMSTWERAESLINIAIQTSGMSSKRSTKNELMGKKQQNKIESIINK